MCVREVAARLDLQKGDVAVTNHPTAGGSHLTDVTVIAAAFDSDGKRIGYVANRAHHAEIGGMAPRFHARGGALFGGRRRGDFTGCGNVHPRNLNATPAIVRSILLYVLRLWLNEDVPLNEGLLEPLELISPTGFLNPEFPDDPMDCPAVVGGNVETSRRLTDLLLAALGLSAHGPGTMNNFLFGNNRFGYYETIAGGAGAGPVRAAKANTRAATA